MSKIGPTLPGIPTDEKPLWEKLQESSKEIVRWALLLESNPGDVCYKLGLLEAARAHKTLLPP